MSKYIVYKKDGQFDKTKGFIDESCFKNKTDSEALNEFDIYEGYIPEIINQEQYDNLMKPNLEECKNIKIKELEDFHESDEVRVLTINNTFKVSTNYEKTRKWFNEIIYDLENESEVTGKSHNDIIFEWEIASGVWLPLKLSQLKQFKYAVFNITRVNFKQYRTHQKAIKELKTKTKVKNYNFKKGYLLNNKLNFDL